MEDYRIFLAKTHSHQLQAAYERCWNAPRTYDLLPEAPLGGAALILAALSVEIGLKALLLDSGAALLRDHNLRTLLDALPQEQREQIVAEVSCAYPDFDQQLTDAEKCFVEWRYFYEATQEMRVNSMFVGALGAAVQRQIGLRWTAA